MKATNTANTSHGESKMSKKVKLNMHNDRDTAPDSYTMAYRIADMHTREFVEFIEAEFAWNGEVSCLLCGCDDGDMYEDDIACPIDAYDTKKEFVKDVREAVRKWNKAA